MRGYCGDSVSRICLLMQETQVLSQNQEDPLEKEMAAHSSIFAEEIPWAEEPGGLQPTRFLCPWDFLGKNPGVGCHFLLQGVFQTQELNLGLLYCRQIPALQADSLPTELRGKSLGLRFSCHGRSLLWF